MQRWSRDQVLALAPDAPSRKAAQGVSAPGKWSSNGTTGLVVFGECRGSGSKPYLACVDLAEPAYRCSCPSRKFPCKHALGLLLLWSADGVPELEAAPQWVTEWMEGRATRAAKSTARLEAARAEMRSDATDGVPPSPTDGVPHDTEGSAAAGTARPGPGGSGARETARPDTESPETSGAASGVDRAGGGGAGRAESVRHGRVAAGLGELERWLADQVRQGLAGAAEHDWEGLAKRLIDAQAPGVAGVVSRLSRVRAEEGWPGRLLEEYALINLLAVAYRRRTGLPGPLAETVLIRTGFPVTREEVLAGPVVRDHWDVLGRRDEQQDRLTARRVWLRGRRTGRPALILSFAPQGQALDASLVTGTTIDADLTYYPGAAPLRALVATRHGILTPPARTPAPDTTPSRHTPSKATPSKATPSQVESSGDARLWDVPPGVSADEALDEVARALAEDPWTESWPLVLAGAVPGRTEIGGLPWHPRSRDPWRLIAVSGGWPLTVAVEWTPQGLRPLTTWDDEGRAVILA
ncbi:SWIM zinc finger family protein [Nonomuraea fuscirosea]|uniref:SWIM zinc finger family protein n=1 Tax=Nonomuraea fuscirosea TaxID=1291556 RepID=UPI0034434CC9